MRQWAFIFTPKLSWRPPQLDYPMESLWLTEECQGIPWPRVNHRFIRKAIGESLLIHEFSQLVPGIIITIKAALVSNLFPEIMTDMIHPLSIQSQWQNIYQKVSSIKLYFYFLSIKGLRRLVFFFVFVLIPLSVNKSELFYLFAREKERFCCLEHNYHLLLNVFFFPIIILHPDLIIL